MKMSDGLSDPCNTPAAPHPIVHEVLITEYYKSTIRPAATITSTYYISNFHYNHITPNTPLTY